MTPYPHARPPCGPLMYTLAIVTAVLFTLIPLSAAEAQLFLDGPIHGSFSTAPQIIASGRVEIEDLSDVMLTINGAVVSLAADGVFSHPVNLDADRLFNPVLVDLTAAGTVIDRQRPVVIAGASLPETALAPESLAVRFTDRGLDQLELLVTRSIDLDVTQFLPPGPLLSHEVCVEIPLLPDVCTDVEVTIANDPAPSLGSVSVDLDAEPDHVNLEIMLQDLFVRAEVDADAASCTITVTADAMRLNGAMHFEVNAVQPADIDIVQAGSMAITFGNFASDTDCGGVLGDILESLIDLLVGNIRERLQDGLEHFLNTSDAAGNTPLASILEAVLNAFSLEALLNASIADSGLLARAPFARISEDSDGITFVFDTRVEPLPASACTTSQDNPALAAIYHVPQPLPVLGFITPGGLPFDVGGAISATLFNQVLRGATACGLLEAEFTEINLSGTVTPITAGLLAVLLPAFNQLDSAEPIRVTLHPSLAPVVTGAPGPAGELLDLRVSAYTFEFLRPEALDPTLQLALDFRAGADLQIEAATGALQPRIGDITDLSATLLINPLGVDESRLNALIELLLSQIDDLNNDLNPVEIPGVEGIDFELVEISPLDAYLGLFLDLIVQP